MRVDRLVDFPYVLVRLQCDLCKRKGAYRLARLATKYGSEVLLDDLIERLSADCPWRDDPRGSGCAHGSPTCRRAGRRICQWHGGCGLSPAASANWTGRTDDVRPIRNHERP